MWKVTGIQECYWCVRTAMIGVTGPAGCSRIRLVQDAVQRGRVLPLRRYVGVTGFAQVRHTGGAPERSMAELASGTNFRMRIDTINWCTSACIQTSRDK